MNRIEAVTKHLVLFYFSIIIGAVCLISLIFSGIVFQPHNWFLSVIFSALLIGNSITLAVLLQKLKIQDDLIKRGNKQDFESIDDLEKFRNRLPDGLLRQRLRNLHQAYLTGTRVTYAEIEYLSQLSRQNFGGLTKYAISASVLLGWIGTFFGILLSINSMPAGQPIDWTLLVEGFRLSIGASILGIATSLFLGFLYTIYKSVENDVFLRLETFTVLRLLPLVSDSQTDQISKAIADSMNRVLPAVVKESTENLIVATDNIRAATTGLLRHNQDVVTLLSPINQSMASIASTHRNLHSLLEGLSQTITEVLSLLQQVDQSLVTYESGFERLSAAQESTLNRLQTVYNSLNSNIEEVRGFSRGFTNGLNQVVTAASTTNQEFRSTVREMVQSLTNKQDQTNKLIVQFNEKVISLLSRIEPHRVSLRPPTFLERLFGGR